ncbi:MAG: DHA2 family efflux MFS transporter permease subunit [Acidimicrobiales bacterium]
MNIVHSLSSTSAPEASQQAISSALPAPGVQRPHLPLAVVVAIACVTQFMVVLDSTIVIVALPAMRAGLHLSPNQQQWVLSSYLIALGGLMLAGARASDLFGRRRVFLLGLGIFTAASLAGGLAVSGPMLLGARIAEGIGAALLAPSSLSLITASHVDPSARHRALALWSVMGGVASSSGLVLGGVLTSALSWRWVLFVNVPIGVALFAVAAWSLLPSVAGSRRRHLDLPAAVSATLGIGLLTYGLSRATTAGWGSAQVAGTLVGAAVSLAFFVAVEATHPDPLIPLGLFKMGNLRIGNLVMAILGVTMTTALYFVALYLEQLLDESALEAGLSLLPMTVVLVAAGLASRRLIVVFGPRRLLVTGALIASGGLAWLSRLPMHLAYLSHVLGPTLVTAVGLGLMLLPVTVAAVNGVVAADAGAASGLLNAARQLGGALGLAVLFTIAQSVARGSMLPTRAAATVQGYDLAILFNAGVLLLSAVLAMLLRDPHETHGTA